MHAGGMIQLITQFAATIVSAAWLGLQAAVPVLMRAGRQQLQNRGESGAEELSSSKARQHNHAQHHLDGQAPGVVLGGWAGKQTAHTCNCQRVGSLPLLGEQHAPEGICKIVLQSTKTRGIAVEHTTRCQACSSTHMMQATASHVRRVTCTLCVVLHWRPGLLSSCQTWCLH